MQLTNEYIEFDTETGFLKLTFTGKKEALQLAFDSKVRSFQHEDVLGDLFEEITANSEYAYIRDISDFGALSNAEGIGLMSEYTIDEIYPKIFWHWHRYQVIFLLEELIGSDGVQLTKSEAENDS